MKASRKKDVFETLFAETTAGFFLREFSFSCTEFTPPKKPEVELADFVIQLDDLLMVFQVKARSVPSDNPEDERCWFERKVVKKATQQVRDTITHLQECAPEIENDRGRRIAMPSGTDPRSIHKIVVFSGAPALPPECMRHRFHDSKTVGLIHIIAASDWTNILHTQVTPREISDYLRMRQDVCLRGCLKSGRWLGARRVDELSGRPRRAHSPSPLGRGQGEGNRHTLTPSPLPRWGEGEASCPSVSHRGLEELLRHALRNPAETRSVSEKALVGQFISDEDNQIPSSSFEGVLDRLAANTETFDLLKFLNLFGDRLTPYVHPGGYLPDDMKGAGSDYYPILVEIAKLPRTDLAAFKERFGLGWQRAGADAFLPPFLRMTSSTGTGFVFAPVPHRLERHAQNGLANFVAAHMYEQRLVRCIGASFVRDGERRLISWLLIERTWAHNPEMEAWLREHPLPPVRMERMPRYRIQ